MKNKSSIYPKSPDEFSDIKKFISEYLIDHFSDHEKFLTPTSRIFAQGSCFAGNIVQSLRKNGFENCSHLDISENFNNTFANKEIIRSLTEGKIKEEDRVWVSEIIRGITFEEAKEKLKNSGVVILTFGVALVLLDAKTNKVQNKLRKTSRLIMSNVDDNSKNIQDIIRMIKSFNSNAKIVITVSPIPLEKTSRQRNVVIDDCISKSTIRASVDMALQKVDSDIIYWPSFEIVRSMNIHYPPSFGSPKKYSRWNGHPRHPNPNLISLTMELFRETFCEL